MSDQWTKERDEAAYIAVDKLFLMPRTDEAGRGLFISGADFGRDYELKRAAELVEKLKAIIWAYENNVG